MTMSLLQFAAVLKALPLKTALMQHEGMEKACEVVEKEAKAAIAHYQEESGPFAAWEPLSPNTLWGGVSPEGHRYPGKIPLGYATEAEHNPELRTGALRDSIEHTVQQGMFIGGTEGAVGSDEDVMIVQELGTSRMPPRSILGGAAARKSDEVAEILGEAAVAALVSGGGLTKIR